MCHRPNTALPTAVAAGSASTRRSAGWSTPRNAISSQATVPTGMRSSTSADGTHGRGRRIPALMLAGGAAATAALIAWAGYPASMVGVNGAHISNLNPPTLAAVSFGIAQCGLALLLRDPLARLMRRPLAWAGIALVNLSAMTLFLWHQTAFVTVSSVGLLAGRVPGLLTAPTSGLWVAERLAWLPVFAIMLSGLWLAFRRVERG